MPNEEFFSLDDLNELSAGLGDRICSLLDRPTNWSGFLRVKEEILKLLAEQKLKVSEVFVNKGSFSGLTFEAALAKAAGAYQFEDQFDS